MSEKNNNLDRKKKSILDGIDNLHKWILLLLDQGIDILQKDENRILDISSRLVDAGVPGIARRLRTISDKTAHTDHWQEYVLKVIGECYLLCKLILTTADISHPDVQQILGIVRRKSDVEEQDFSVQDQWVYLGSISSKEDKMMMFRHWFIGLETRKQALYIEYVFNKFNRPRIFELGKSYGGKIFFYPSQVPQRVTSIPTISSLIPTGFEFRAESIPEFLNRHTSSIIQFPWLNHNLALLSNFKIQRIQNNLFLVDKAQEAIPIHLEADEEWRLKALSMDSQLILVSDYEEKILKPISYIHHSWVMKI